MASTYHFSAMTRAEMTALRAEPTLEWDLILGRPHTSACTPAIGQANHLFGK